MRIDVRLVVVATLFATGCAQCGAPEPLSEVERPSAPAPGESQLDRPFVVFGVRRLVIDRTGSAFDAPVTPGSRASRDTIESEDPGIVEIDAEGRLVGVSAGRTFVHSRVGESRIEVVVRPAQTIRIEPAQIVLRPGATAALTLIDAATGEALDATVATWTIAPPDAASVWRGEVRAGLRDGRAVVSAHYGGLEGSCELVVKADAERLTVNPGTARLRVGQVLAFQAFRSSGPVAVASWRSTDARILKGMQGGLFAAVRPGRARVCVGSSDVDGCAMVEVRP